VWDKQTAAPILEPAPVLEPFILSARPRAILDAFLVVSSMICPKYSMDDHTTKQRELNETYRFVNFSDTDDAGVKEVVK
jgi:hypothetical protein